MGQVSIGLAKVEIAPITGGTIGAYQILGKTNIDSATIAQEEGTTNDFYAEEQDNPIYTRKVKGKTTLSMEIIDPNLAAYQFVFGGEITGTGDAAVWTAPESIKDREVALKITPEEGYIISTDKAILSGNFNMQLGKNQLQRLPITADFLAPVKIGGIVTSLED